MDTNTFSTAAEAEAAIVKAIEAGDVDDAYTEFDMDTICDTLIEADYSGINPTYHLDEENFWETVEVNAR